MHDDDDDDDDGGLTLYTASSIVVEGGVGALVHTPHILFGMSPSDQERDREHRRGHELVDVCCGWKSPFGARH